MSLAALAYARRSWRVFGSGAAPGAAPDAFAIGGASPELVAAFTTQSDGTTAGEYYRKASSETTFSGLFTHSVSGLLTMFNSGGTLCWNPHNYIGGTTLVTAGYPTTGWYVPSPQTYGVTDFLGGTTAMTITNSYTQHIPTGTPVDGAKYRMSFVMKLGTQPHGVLAACRLKNSGTAEYIAFNATTGNPQNVDPDYDDSGMTDLGDGWWYCWADMTATSSGNFFMLLRADDLLTASWDGSATFCHPSIRRIDLPMADNPDIPTLPWFVPNTTGAAKYLPRRQAYRYNSGWELAGMQMEAAAATNLYDYGNLLASVWTEAGGTLVDANATLLGTANLASTFTEDTSTGLHRFYDFVPGGAVAGVTYTYSLHLKANGRSKVQVTPGSGVMGTFTHDFDLSAGTAVETSAGTSGQGCGIIDLGSGEYRIYGSWTQVSNGANGPVYALHNGTGTIYTGDGSSGVIAYGAQIETGLIPTSYIPTTGSTVTRAAETLSIAGADSPISATEATLAADVLLTSDGRGPEIFNITSGANWVRIYPRNSASTYAQWRPSYTPEVTAAQGGTISAGINQPVTVALGIKASDEVQLVAQGNAGTAVATTSITDFSGRDIGITGNIGEGSFFYKTIRIWSTKLPEADLITAGTAS